MMRRPLVAGRGNERNCLHPTAQRKMVFDLKQMTSHNPMHHLDTMR